MTVPDHGLDPALALDGGALSLAWALPFAGLLLSIALLPALAPRLWHRHAGIVAAAWVLAFLVPCVARFGVDVAAYQVVRVELLDFLPFILLIGALYTVTGGIRITGTVGGTPLTNTGVLALGTLLASLMGTTGAAMLLIRPLLRANRGRRHRVHVVVFFIFLVANIGGALSPLGDPPLFLGFLQGVDFFWTTRHLLAPTALTVAVLLALFFAIDLWCWRLVPTAEDVPEREPWGLAGGANVGLLAAITGALLLQALWHPGLSVSVLRVGVAVEKLAADLLLLAVTVASLRLIPMAQRRPNAFSWRPLTEVTILFGAIFVTIVPAMAILQAGSDGAAAPLLAVPSRDGRPDDALYFWMTGLLSSLLDNAPTYLIFFQAAGGDAPTLMTGGASTLAAISAGAVFMGAMTYIGNVPNMLVKTIAEEQGVPLPGFFGYMVWSSCLLLPLFAVLTLVFFR